MASPQQSRIQSYLERNKIGPLFEVSALNATLKFLAANWEDGSFAPDCVNPLLHVAVPNDERTSALWRPDCYSVSLSRTHTHTDV